MIHSFSFLNQVPQCTELIDIALSKTNRKTPTIVRARYEIHRIRSFYVRKVKFSAEQFCNRLRSIVEEFPVLENIHPFYRDLINVLYDRDHYKIALGQINTTRHRVEFIEKEHVKLLKFADSLYRCKELKKAALGKMATRVKKLSEPLRYLEEVRQHMTRLPSIDPAARTIVICGFPNVGKSSFMNRITTAHVDVQSYAFTTKSLFVGHFDYKDLRWQVLDTPGILDKPLTDRNSIEMLTITALAHLKSAVLFFMDLSASCGHSMAEQIALYDSLAPLLSQQILIVFSKSDLLRLEAVQNGCEQSHCQLRAFLQDKHWLEASAETGFNVEAVKNTICDMLLSVRMTEKEDRLGDFSHRIKPYVPVVLAPKYDQEHLGQSLFLGLPENESYYSENKYDVIPEIFNGKNISDFLDENIQLKLEEVTSMVGSDSLRRFDILSREERDKYDEVNNARMTAIMQTHFVKRSTLPPSWINPVTSTGELTADIHRVTPVEKKPREVHNKRIQRDTKGTYADTKPKHAFRPKSKKLSRK